MIAIKSLRGDRYNLCKSRRTNISKLMLHPWNIPRGGDTFLIMAHAHKMGVVGAKDIIFPEALIGKRVKIYAEVVDMPGDAEMADIDVNVEWGSKGKTADTPSWGLEWTPQDERIIKANIDKPWKEIASILGRTTASAKAHAKVMGLLEERKRLKELAKRKIK